MTAPEQMRAEDGGPLVDRLRGRASFLHAVGQTKSASLMDEAAEALTRPATDELVEALRTSRAAVQAFLDMVNVIQRVQALPIPAILETAQHNCPIIIEQIGTALRNAGAAS